MLVILGLLPLNINFGFFFDIDKITCWDFDYDYVEFIDQAGKI